MSGLRSRSARRWHSVALASIPSARSLGSKARHIGSMPPEQPTSSSVNFSLLSFSATNAENDKGILKSDRRHGRRRRADGAGQAQRRRGQQEARALAVAQPQRQVLQPPDLAEIEAE